MAEELTELTDEMKAAIGSSGPPGTTEVTSTDIRLFARAVGYRDPLYYDEEEAKRRGHRALPAPPGYFGRPIFNPTRGAAGPGEMGGGFSSPFRRMLNGGTEVEPLARAYAGDVLTAVTTLTDLQLRQSRMGQMLIRTSETVYTNQNGEVVGKMRGTLLQY